ncbi:spore coat protein [Clostridium yunnanense]
MMMSTILEGMGIKDTAMNDEVIVSNMLAGAKGAANAYLNATLTSPTPELRAMYASSLSQVLNGHAAISELAVKRGWEQPYAPTTEQLSDAFKKSEDVIDKDK